jgi:DNA-binding transcriptional LysR family regulator
LVGGTTAGASEPLGRVRSRRRARLAAGAGEVSSAIHLPGRHAGGSPTFNDYSTVVQAALDGQGVALGWHHIVTALVDDGRLARLDDRTVTTSSPFVVLTRPQLVEPPLVTSLRHWLIRELADP